jgi:hypothetical protein
LLEQRIADALRSACVEFTQAELASIAASIDPHGKLELACSWEEKLREIDQCGGLTVDGCNPLAEYRRRK